MNWTLGLIIFACGMVAGMLLSGPLSRLTLRIRRVFYKPAALRPFVPGKVAAASNQEPDDRDKQA